MARPRTPRDLNVHCPECGGVDVIKCGQWYNYHIQGVKQRYKCLHCGKSFYYEPPKMRQYVERKLREDKE